ncbi:hypothetical protein NPIL_667821, partial [Nephila pilipes]
MVMPLLQKVGWKAFNILAARRRVQKFGRDYSAFISADATYPAPPPEY